MSTFTAHIVGSRQSKTNKLGDDDDDNDDDDDDDDDDDGD